MRAMAKTMFVIWLIAAFAFFLGLGLARADGVTSVGQQSAQGDKGNKGNKGDKGDQGPAGATPTVGTCTLDGMVTPTCAATVPSGCVPICSYLSSALPHVVSCAVSGTTLTAVSATMADSGTVAYTCF